MGGGVVLPDVPPSAGVCPDVAVPAEPPEVDPAALAADAAEADAASAAADAGVRGDVLGVPGLEDGGGIVQVGVGVGVGVPLPDDEPPEPGVEDGGTECVVG